MDKRAQGAVEYLLILAAVLITVAGVVSALYFSSSSLFSTVHQQVENVLENEVLPGLASFSDLGGLPEASASPAAW
ncbi:MAG: class III signal peptide-containing protein [Candidatus Hadarchaeales archaeon]